MIERRCELCEKETYLVFCEGLWLCRTCIELFLRDRDFVLGILREKKKRELEEKYK